MINRILSLFAILILSQSLNLVEGQPPPVITPRMYGVNLGGWFVLERFLNPSILLIDNDPNIQDEYTYCQVYQNNPEKLQIVRDHWDSWVSEEDIRKLRQIGFTHLRIPIGYWSMYSEEELRSYGDPYLTGQWYYMERVIGWLKKYHLKAIIELHGAPGSQNGWDNSGQVRDPVWGTGDTINRTLVVLDRMTAKIKEFELNDSLSGVVIGFGVINEPFPPLLPGGIEVVKDYYIQAYPVVRKHLPAERYAYIIDHAFSNAEFPGFMSEEQYQNVWLDAHVYHVFEPGLRSLTPSTHLQVACESNGENILRQTLPTIVGEWSIAYKIESDKAAGEPYPTLAERKFLLEFARSQMKVYHNFFFWNFKTENAPMWDYFMGYDGGWLPQFPDEGITRACPSWTYSPTELDHPFTAGTDESGNTATWEKGTSIPDPCPKETATRDDTEENSELPRGSKSSDSSVLSFAVSVIVGVSGYLVLHSLM